MNFIRVLERKHFDIWYDIMKYFIIFTLLISSFSFAKEDKDSISLEFVLSEMLKHNPTILKALESFEYQKAALQVQQGSFDVGVNIYGQHGISDNISGEQNVEQTTGLKETYKTYNNVYNATLSKKLYQGIDIQGGVSSTRTKTQSSSYFRDNSNDATTTNSVFFTLDIPLMKGLGSENTLANIKTAQKGVLEAKYNILNTISSVASQTISAYWNYLASVRLYQIALESERLTQKLVQNTKKMIDYKQQASSVLKHPLANLKSKTISRISAKNTLMSNWKSLVILIGSKSLFALPLDPRNDFPQISDMNQLSLLFEKSLFNMALKHRADLKILKEKREALKIMKRYSANQMEPDLSLQISSKYNNVMMDDSYSKMYQYDPNGNHHGFNLDFKLVYQFDIENNQAKGAYKEALSNLRSNLLSENELKQSIEISLIQLVDSLKGYSEQNTYTQEMISLYSEVIEDEKKKFSMGISTVDDVISAQNKYISAKQTQLNTLLAYASNLSSLKHESGVLVYESSQGEYIINAFLDIKKIVKGNTYAK